MADNREFTDEEQAALRKYQNAQYGYLGTWDLDGFIDSFGAERRNMVSGLVQALTTAERLRQNTEAQLENSRRAYQDFKDKVRAKAKEVADAQTWCRGGLNRTMRELGLEPFVNAWRITIDTFTMETDETTAPDDGDIANYIASTLPSSRIHIIEED